MILVKSSLCEMRLNTREVTFCEVTLHEVMSHQCDYSLLHISLQRGNNRYDDNYTFR